MLSDEARAILRKMFPDLLTEIEEYLSFAEIDALESGMIVTDFLKWRDK